MITELGVAKPIRLLIAALAGAYILFAAYSVIAEGGFITDQPAPKAPIQRVDVWHWRYANFLGEFETTSQTYVPLDAVAAGIILVALTAYARRPVYLSKWRKIVAGIAVIYLMTGSAVLYISGDNIIKNVNPPPSSDCLSDSDEFINPLSGLPACDYAYVSMQNYDFITWRLRYYIGLDYVYGTRTYLPIDLLVALSTILVLLGRSSFRQNRTHAPTSPS